MAAPPAPSETPSKGLPPAGPRVLMAAAAPVAAANMSPLTRLLPPLLALLCLLGLSGCKPAPLVVTPKEVRAAIDGGAEEAERKCVGRVLQITAPVAIVERFPGPGNTPHV